MINYLAVSILISTFITGVTPKAPISEGVPKPNVPSEIQPLKPLKAKKLTRIAPKLENKPQPIKKSPPSTSIRNCGDNKYKQFIYQHESGCDPAAVNPSGCRGIGQDCNGNLANACPNWQTDYNCQDQFFTRYMQSRYGSWSNAVAFWESHNWW